MDFVGFRVGPSPGGTGGSGSARTQLQARPATPGCAFICICGGGDCYGSDLWGAKGVIQRLANEEGGYPKPLASCFPVG